jgi:hypothetical protein
MLKEFLISRNDGRCLYFLAEEEKYDPQLIAGYLASLNMFMKTNHNQTPKMIITDKGIWIIVHSLEEEFFIAASTNSTSIIDAEIIQEKMLLIFDSLIILTGNKVIPLLETEKSLREIIDTTIRTNLSRILDHKDLTKFKPGIVTPLISF